MSSPNDDAHDADLLDFTFVDLPTREPRARPEIDKVQAKLAAEVRYGQHTPRTPRVR